MYNYVEKMFGTITIDSAGQISSKTAFEYFLQHKTIKDVKDPTFYVKCAKESLEFLENLWSKSQYDKKKFIIYSIQPE